MAKVSERNLTQTLRNLHFQDGFFHYKGLPTTPGDVVQIADTFGRLSVGPGGGGGGNGIREWSGFLVCTPTDPIFAYYPSSPTNAPNPPVYSTASGPNPIQRAIDDAHTQSLATNELVTVLIRPGTYAESITLREGVMLKAAESSPVNFLSFQPNSVIIIGQAQYVFSGTSKICRVEGISFSTDVVGLPAVSMTGTQSVIEFTSCTFSSTVVQGATDCLIRIIAGEYQVNMKNCQMYASKSLIFKINNTSASVQQGCLVSIEGSTVVGGVDITTADLTDSSFTISNGIAALSEANYTLTSASTVSNQLIMLIKNVLLFGKGSFQSYNNGLNQHIWRVENSQFRTVDFDFKNTSTGQNVILFSGCTCEELQTGAFDQSLLLFSACFIGIINAAFSFINRSDMVMAACQVQSSTNNIAFDFTSSKCTIEDSVVFCTVPDGKTFLKFRNSLIRNNLTIQNARIFLDQINNNVLRYIVDVNSVADPLCADNIIINNSYFDEGSLQLQSLGNLKVSNSYFQSYHSSDSVVISPTDGADVVFDHNSLKIAMVVDSTILAVVSKGTISHTGFLNGITLLGPLATLTFSECFFGYANGLYSVRMGSNTGNPLFAKFVQCHMSGLVFIIVPTALATMEVLISDCDINTEQISSTPLDVSHTVAGVLNLRLLDNRVWVDNSAPPPFFIESGPGIAGVVLTSQTNWSNGSIGPNILPSFVPYGTNSY